MASTQRRLDALEGWKRQLEKDRKYGKRQVPFKTTKTEK